MAMPGTKKQRPRAKIGLELARAAHEGDAGAGGLEKALAALAGARLGAAASRLDMREDDADVGDRR